MPQASPGPYQYAGYNGPFAPPQAPYDYSQVYAPVDGQPYHPMGPPGYGLHPGNPSYMPSPAMINPGVAPPPAMPPPGTDSMNGNGDLGHSTASFDKEALKNAPGLSCKACQLQSTHHLMGAYYQKPEERKTYTVLTLFQHFRAQHLSSNPSGMGYGQAPAALDWKEDMIELPGERIISGLIHAPGMDDEKLLMIATTFPSLFPHPLPTIGKIEDDGLTSPTSSVPMKDALRASGTPGAALDRSSVNVRGSRTQSPRPSKPVDDEYNPDRPSTATDRANQPPSLGQEAYYLDDGYGRPREYMEYAPSPRMFHSAPVYDEYSGRRTGFREADRFYGPPTE
ncbi:hypothetical protein C7974DRAFT_419099 [Boeremia exigua]|uniref:uncharacterized protein n=1 Tax=Boeremia exigua TaxID=749465 RepID=UPI001E8E7C00|nr:uncharacterized protein C7974DRAFT_419099 [Boeremia exigua]KAH6611656.1 hypothetical protein C7974DRAFT_419099 [Boeremia exigua]